jgi:hypothetical protein
VAFRVISFILGCGLVFTAISSAVQTFVVPRGARNGLTRLVFVLMRYVFDLPLRRASQASRERALAYYAPVTLLTLPVFWLSCVLLGYAGIYRALGAANWSTDITISRLSLLYLGSDISSIPGGTVFAFSETVSSLLLAAILVSYLPTMYGAFSQREQAVTGLATRAGSPPSPVKMLTRYHAIDGLGQLSEVWSTWQAWFEMVEESHTALLPLVYYRSPQPDRSWVTAAGAVLDTASVVASTLDRPRDPQAELCIRAGYLCLQRIAAPFGIPFNPTPEPTDPITVSRLDFDSLYDALAEIGIPLKADRDQAWRDFAGWRVNYDAVLVGLAVMTLSPPGYWSFDRVPHRRPLFSTAVRTAQQAAAAAINGRSLT